jgi:hypothetical protein
MMFKMIAAACVVTVGSFSAASAMPIVNIQSVQSPAVTSVGYRCGPGRHLSPRGFCAPNYYDSGIYTYGYPGWFGDGYGYDYDGDRGGRRFFGRQDRWDFGGHGSGHFGGGGRGGHGRR